MATSVTLKPNAIDISGSTSGTTTLQASAVAGTTTLTLPAATDTLVGKATTDTLTNKTLTTPTINQFSSAASTALTIQSAGTTAMTIDTSQNVGIGTSSPSYKLHVASGKGYISGSSASNQGEIQLVNTDASGGSWRLGDSVGTAAGAFSVYDALNSQVSLWYQGGASGSWRFYTNASERMRIDSSGRVGIGTSSPSYKLDVNNNTNTFVARFTGGTSSDVNIGLYANTASAFGSVGTISNHKFQIFTNGADVATFDTSGNLLVGTTSAGPYDATGTTSASATIKLGGFGFATNAPSTTVGIFNRTNTTGTVIEIKYNASIVGTISTNGSTTAYNTSSDYRLKENIAPMTGGLDTVSKLKPVTYKWKIDGSDGQGFIAHELQAVVPDCVTGEKDAVDEEGKPKYQGVDTSFLVATLVAAIQEQQTIIEQLKADVAALKGA